MKLTIKLSVTYLCLLMVTSIVLMVTVYFVMKQKSLFDATSYVNYKSHCIQNDIEEFLYQRSAKLDIIAKDPVISSLDSSPLELRKKLIEYRNSMKVFNDISIFTPDGIRIAGSSGIYGGKVPEGFEHKDFPSGKNGISDEVEKSYTMKIFSIYGFFNLLDKNGKIFRIVQTSTSLPSLHSFMASMLNQKGSLEGERIELIEKGGRLIYSNVDRNISLKKMIDTNEILQNENSDKAVTLTNYDYQLKQPLLTTVISIKGFLSPEQEWILRVSIPENTVLAPIYTFIRLLAGITILITLLSLIPIYFLSGRLSLPIRRLAAAAKRIEKGDYGAKIEIKTSGEMRDLITAFNEMSQNLARSQDELKNYNLQLEKLVAIRTEALNNSLKDMEKKNLELIETKNRLEFLSKNLEDQVREKTFYLIRERQKLLTAQAISNSAIFEYNIINNSFIWNEGDYKLLGTELLSQRIKSFDTAYTLIHHDDLERFKNDCSKALSNGEINEIYRLIINNNKTEWVKIVGRIYYTENHQPSMVLGAISNITDFMESVRNLAAIQEQLFQLHKVETIGSLYSGITHDINNILATIIGFANLFLSDYTQKNKDREYIENIVTLCEKGLDIVKQILSFIKPVEKKLEAVDIISITNETLKMIGSSLKQVATVSLCVIPKQHPKIMGDRVQIEQLMINLLSNAMDAMKGKWGKLDITIDEVFLNIDDSAKIKVSSGSYVKLIIKDTGKGMSEEVKRRIFEPFFTTKAEKGTGLGLMVVQKVVNNHNGAIQIESESGVGTAISIYFPTLKS